MKQLWLKLSHKKSIAALLCIALLLQLVPFHGLQKSSAVDAESQEIRAEDYNVLYDDGTGNFPYSTKAIGMAEGDSLTILAEDVYIWSIEGSNSNVVFRDTSGEDTSLATDTARYIAREPGLVSIVLRTDSDPTPVIKINITVDSALGIDSSYIVLQANDAPYAISAIASEKSGKNFVWEVEDPTIATITPDTKDPAKAVITPLDGGTSYRETSFTLTQTVGAAIKKVSGIIRVEVPVTSVTINGVTHGYETMNVDDQIALTALLTPSFSYNKGVTWASSDESVVDVTANGLNAYITALAPGMATVSVTTHDQTITATYDITVKQPISQVYISSKYENATIRKGQTIHVYPTIDPPDTTEPEFKFSSSNPDVVKITENDGIYGVNPGKAIVTILPQGKGIYEPAIINITVGIPVSEINIDPASATMYKGASRYVYPMITPTNASNKEVRWVSSNTNIVSVTTVNDSARLTANARGTATITCTTLDGALTSTCKITVKEYVSSVTLPKSSMYLRLGASYTAKPSILPTSASDKTVTWTSSNSKIASVNKTTGKVTGLRVGVVTITCTSNDPKRAKTTMKIGVVRQVTSIRLSHSSFTGVDGESYTLTATYAPSNATQKKVKWSSSETSVATVSSTGKVTVRGTGVSKITATTIDGGNKSKSCYVYGIEPIYANSIRTNTSKIVLTPGQRYTLRAALSPSNSTEHITFRINRSSVASVNQSSGLVIARNPGVAYITVRSGNTNRTESVLVSVLAISKRTLTLRRGQKYTLVIGGATLTPVWRSSRTSIATVTRRTSNSAIVRARRVGVTNIYARVSGRLFRCQVRVIR